MKEGKADGGWSWQEWGEGIEGRMRKMEETLAFYKGAFKVLAVIVGVIVIPLVLLYLKQKLFKGG